MIKTTKIETPLGEMIAGATEAGICLLEFADRDILSSDYEDLIRFFDTNIKSGRNKYLRLLKKQLKEYFKGKRKEFSVPLITPGTEFQQAAWKELLKIPYGTTRSYHEQAAAIKNPDATRAVAHANASNRIAIVIPCHRVIGADGHLVGYGGGLKRKKWLLDHEKKYSGKAVDLDLF
jgi:AraC family transcriptional regulator, regulatory protein of adaptative response / methylated-DNA-[protein]-cysteine methyltransferase